MSTLSFAKYQGAGNDFILIDDRSRVFPVGDRAFIRRLCQPKWGIGADGLILLQEDEIADVRMRIFNSDGGEASSCGNGLRCFLRFLADLGFPLREYRVAVGERIVKGSYRGDWIYIDLGAPHSLQCGYRLGPWEVHAIDTGVPHAVVFVPDVERVELLSQAPLIRHHTALFPSGINVNFAQINSDGSMHLRTFERGIEGETLACGTGAAAAVVIACALKRGSGQTAVYCPGGKLDILWNGSDSLQVGGPASQVFSGTILADLNCSIR